MKNLFPAEIVVDYTDKNITIKAPRRVMQYYKTASLLNDFKEGESWRRN